MSDINIRVIYTSTKEAVSDKGTTYNVMEVTYKNLTHGDKVETKKIFDFANKDVWAVMVRAQKDDTFCVERAKDKTGQYWNWVNISRQDAPPAAAADKSRVAATAVKSTYETAEERAVKQRYIIRQSCLNVAAQVASLTGDGNPEALIATAKQLEVYVLSPLVAETTPLNISDFEDDIPF